MLTKKDLAAIKKIIHEEFKQLNENIDRLLDKAHKNHAAIIRVENKIDLIYAQTKREKVPPQLKRKEIRC